MYRDVWKQVFKLTKKSHFQIILSVVLLTATLILIQLKPIVIQKLIDGAVAGENISSYVIQMGILLFVVTVFFRLFDIVAVKVMTRTYESSQNHAMEHIMKHSHAFFTDNFSGSLVAKSKRFANSVNAVYELFVFNIYNAILMIIITTIILFFKNKFIALIFLGWAIIYSIVSIFIRKKQIQYDEAQSKEDSRTTAKLADILTNMLTVKMFSATDKEDRSFKKQTKQQKEVALREWYHKLKVMVIQSILLASLEFATIYFAVKLYNAGTITLGVIVLIQIYALTIFGSVWNLGRGIQKLSSHLSDMKEMVDIITLEPTVKDPIKPETVKIKKGQITFENVSFKYEKESILDDFNLEIKAGEKIGLVGISGSGKSTLTKLLLRFYDPTSGKIKIDDQDISKIKREHLRNEITYVPQEQLLFHRTLKENIAYSKKATDNEVIAASKKANAHEFISKLPKGYDTLVGERGIKLSGGERQRVAIARAILKEAPILIMDEATSSLDTLSEKYIQESTEKLMKNKTAIIIAHRLSTVQRLDRIIVLKKGKIVEQGTHKQLIEKKGEYYKLYQHQNL